MSDLEQLPPLPPIKRDPELPVLPGTEHLTLVDPSVPEDLTVAVVLGEHGGKIPANVEVDGNGVFSVDADNNLIGTDSEGQRKVYDPNSKQWVTHPEHY